VDTHRHTWQTQLRGLCADWTLGDYFNGIRTVVSPAYAAEDVRVGNHLGAVEALHAGITTLLDFSHCMNTPEHADAAIEGLRAAGGALHTGCVWGSRVTGGIRALARQKLLSAEQVHVHCNTLDADDWQLLRQHGCKVSTSPETELNMGMGALAIGRCLELGID